MMLIDLLDAGLSQTLNLLKKKPHNICKMQCSEVQQNEV